MSRLGTHDFVVAVVGCCGLLWVVGVVVYQWVASLGVILLSFRFVLLHNYRVTCSLCICLLRCSSPVALGLSRRFRT